MQSSWGNANMPVLLGHCCTRCCLHSYQGCTDMSCTPSLALLIVEIHQLLPLPRVLPPLPQATSFLVLSLYTYVDTNLYDPCVKIHTIVSGSCVYVHMSLTQGDLESERRETRREGERRRGKGTRDRVITIGPTPALHRRWRRGTFETEVLKIRLICIPVPHRWNQRICVITCAWTFNASV